jgi:hypothetical protein
MNTARTLAPVLALAALSSSGCPQGGPPKPPAGSAGTDPSTAAPAQVTTSLPPPPLPEKPPWTLDTKMMIPFDRPAGGLIGGKPFRVEKTRLNPRVRVLHLIEGDADAEVTLFLPDAAPGKGPELEGERFEFGPDKPGSRMPHVSWSRKAPPGGKIERDNIVEGFAMRLEFGRKNPAGRIPARLYLCLPKKPGVAEGDVVAGTFEMDAE